MAEQQSDIRWEDVSGMDVIGGHLYFALTDGNLYRAEVDGFEPVAGTTELVSDDRNWDNNLLAFVAESAMSADPNGAEIVFASSGTDTFQSFRAFEFSVDPGEPVVLRLSWLDPDALLDLRVRDANDVLVASDTTLAGSPKWLTVPAGDGGIYTASVLIQQGNTSYTLQINPEEQPPAPLADFEFSSAGSLDNGRRQVFNFDVEAGELVTAQVSWDDPAADVRVFLRDESGTSRDSDVDDSGSGMVSAIAETGGQWSVAVIVNESELVRYDVLVDTTTDFTVPEPLADFEFSSSGSTDSGRRQVFRFDVEAGELVEAQVNWDIVDADVRVFLRDETNTLVERDIEGAGTGMVSAIAESGGQWSVAVQINSSDVVSYDVLVDTTSDFTLPEPLADFEFSSSGSMDSGRRQVFRFDVEVGELVEAQVNWDIVDADVRVFLRDETNTTVERDIEGAGTGMVSAIAESSGQWSVAVQVNNSDTVSYDVLVDTTTDFTVPEPLADFEFSSSGTMDDGRFQVFRFDVTAGELVETMVMWDDADAPVTVFLRNESGTQVDRDSNGNGLSMLSVVAETTGQWSVAVRVNSPDTVNYDVLVNTTTDFEVPEPLADFEFSSSGSLDSGRFQVFRFDVTAGELVESMVIWDEQSANVRVFLRDETGSQVARDIEGGGLSMLSVVAQTGGQWSIAVQVNSTDTVDYDVLVDTSDAAAP